jgi:hypothetical protein
VFALAGCAETFALPMTRLQLVTCDSGPALVTYLGHPDASPGVCDLRANGPHVRTFDDDMRASLVDGLVEGHIEPELWRRCAGALLRSAPRDQSASLCWRRRCRRRVRVSSRRCSSAGSPLHSTPTAPPTRSSPIGAPYSKTTRWVVMQVRHWRLLGEAAFTRAQGLEPHEPTIAG